MGTEKDKEKKLKAYKKKVKQKLENLYPVFAKVSIGDFSEDVDIPEEEDEFTELFVGVQIMQDVLREKIEELENWNDKLKQVVSEQTKELQKAQQIAATGSWKWDPVYDEMEWSDELYRIYGYKPGDKKVTYNSFIKPIHPDDKKAVEKKIDHCLKEKSRFNIHYRILQNKKERTIHAKGRVVKNKKGSAIKMVGTCQDVTESKKKEKKFWDLLESAPDAMVISNSKGVIELVNQQAEKLFGYQRSELIGKKDGLLMPGRFSEIFKKHRKNYVSSNQKRPVKKTLQFSGKKKNGTEFPVEISLSPIETESGKLISAVFRDITQRKKIENELQKSRDKLEEQVESRTLDLKKTVASLEGEISQRKKAEKQTSFEKDKLQTYLQVAGVMFIVINKDGMVDLINKKGCEVLGYKEKEIVGKNWFKLALPETECKTREKKFREVMRKSSGKDFQYKGEIITKEGDKRIISWHETPFEDISGKKVGILASGEDITAFAKAREKEIELAAIVESSDDAIIGKTIDGIITSWNKGAENLYGYYSKEVIGKSIEIIFPKGKKTELKEIMKKLKKGKSIDHHETKRVTKEGEIIHVATTISPIVDYTGEVRGASAISKNITEQKEIREALKESERKYRSLVENMNEGVMKVDNDDVIQFVNKKFCSITGYSEKELLGKTAYKLLLPDTSKKEINNLIRERKKGLSGNYELKVRTKSGEDKWVLVSGTPVFDKHNNVIGSTGIHTDVTQRKLYEEAINSLARFPRENPSPIVRYSMTENSILYRNRPAKKIAEFFRPQSKDGKKIKWLDTLKNIYEQGQPKDVELDTGNEIFQCNIVPIRNEGYLNVYATEVSEIKKAKKEIRRLSLALSKTDNGVIITDPNGKIEWVNEGFTHMSGYFLEDVKGTYGEVLRKGKSTGIKKGNRFFKMVTKNKKPVNYEARNFDKEGKEYWVYTTLSPILNSKGEVENIVAIDSNITSRKKAEKTLVKAKKIAEQTARSKQQFLANMSHEIRTPMNAIMGITQLMEGTDLSSSQAEYLNSIKFAADNLLNIINDVLDFSKIDAGKIALEKVGFEPEKLVHKLIESVKYKAEEKNLSLKTDIDPGVPAELKGDPLRISQILTNLIGNSIKFTESGEVKVQVKLEDKKEKEAKIRFDVSDTGIGIPESKVANIFEAFEQADSHTTRNFGGTGLGLTIVKRLVDIQGGKVYIKSEEGKGTTFSVILNFKIPDLKQENVSGEKSPEQKKKDYSALLENKKVLLVEDNELNQLVAEKFMQGWKMKVDIAENGKEALKKLRNSNYDLILMDIQMPEMNGYDASKCIREDFKDPKCKTPILAMTAHAFKGEKEKCLKAGMDDYISKPFEKDKFKEKIVEITQLAE